MINIVFSNDNFDNLVRKGILYLHNKEHHRVISATSPLFPHGTQHRCRGRTDNGGVGFVYGRYRQPPSSGSGTGSASGRGSDRLAGGGHEFSDGADSHAFTEEDDLERPDAGETADSESDEFVVLPKGVRAHAGQYFWPMSK